MSKTVWHLRQSKIIIKSRAHLDSLPLKGLKLNYIVIILNFLFTITAASKFDAGGWK
jgi:hypothetical protein